MSLPIGETCMFEFDADVSAGELESALAEFELAGDVLELTKEQRKSACVCGTERFQVGLLYYMHVGPEQEYVDKIGRLGEFVMTIANSEVFFYPDTCAAEEYDDQNTYNADLDGLLKHLAGTDRSFVELTYYRAYLGYFWRFALKASSPSEGSRVAGD